MFRIQHRLLHESVPLERAPFAGSLRFDCAAIIAATVLLFIVSSRASAQSPAEKLFLESPAAPQKAALPSSSLFVRSKLVQLNAATAAQVQTATVSAPVRILIDLFSNEQFTALIDRSDVLAPGRVTCRGHVEGWLNSQVILTWNQSALAGSVFLPGRGSFQIQYAGNGWQRIGEMDAQHLPRCGVTNFSTQPLASPKSAQLIGPSPANAQPKSGTASTIIDLLVIYTPDARDGAGGTNGILALIDTAVAEANMAYENSQVNARLRVVHAEEVDYGESGDINLDLDNVEQGNSGSGPIADLGQLRAQYQADLVCMITETTDGPLGLANQMNDVDVSFGSNAFSVVQRQYANTYYVLAHELGHNMGCQHDRANSSGSGAFSFSYGYRFAVSNINYHTIMATQPGLPIPYFSNPAVSFQGVPTGVAEQFSNSANNAKAINLTAATVAQFSSLVSTGTPPQVTLVGLTNGASFVVPAVIELNADAQDADGEVTKVEFYVDGSAIGEAQVSPFILRWTNTTPRTVSIRAVVTDNEGLKADSAAIAVTFRSPPPAFNSTASRRLPDGTFRLRVTGVNGQNFRIDASADLSHWMPLLTNQFANGFYDFTDWGATNSAKRFYRMESWP